MTNIDQFESVFRSASRAVFQYAPVNIESVLVVTDMDATEADGFAARVRGFLETLGERELDLRAVAGDAFGGPEALVQLVEGRGPDLVCTYRCLHSDAWKYPHSLGVYVDVLTQVASAPVLLLPHPRSGQAFDREPGTAPVVVAITDDLENDHHLVSWAVEFAKGGGTLRLAHVEDRAYFEHVIEAISKIASIDTDDARESLSRQLLKDPHDYVSSCRQVLEAAGVRVNIEEAVGFGHSLSEYRRHVEDRRVDLLVMNTKDDDQLAMHGLAYPLAVELRNVPLLML